MPWGVAPSTSHWRPSPLAHLDDQEALVGRGGGLLTTRSSPPMPAPPMGVRLSSHSATGMTARMAKTRGGR